MVEVLKYDRLRGKILKRIGNDRITTSCLGKLYLVLGTADGHLYILGLGGDLIKSYRPHDRPINCISIDGNNTTIASCSDNGLVVVYSIGSDNEDKETIVHFNEPVKSICLDDNSNGKRERSFIVGGQSGQLVYHRTLWFTQKDIILFNGADSPISNIVWRRNLVAWADALNVRLIDITTQTAICYLECPSGLDIQYTLPCILFWESDSDLFIGWADSFRHLELIDINNNLDNKNIIARTVSEWHTDCIICGLSSFDADNIILLGYPLPNESTLSYNQVEVQILARNNGDMICVDILPLKGEVHQPWYYSFLSTYNCICNSRDANKWRLSDIFNIRGGLRGLPPTTFVIGPQDFVLARVRDVNDRISSALKDHNLKLAVNLAFNDKLSLHHYRYHELMTLYIDDLLDSGQLEEAARECTRLISNDIILWERWIYVFAKRRCLHVISDMIPIERPRLPNPIYELVIETFLHSSSKALLDVVDRWGYLDPPVFNRGLLLNRLEAAREMDPWYLETQAKLYMISNQHENALDCYLSIATNPKMDPFVSEKNFQENIEMDKNKYQHVFELIEKHNLFDVIKDKIVNLVKLSKDLSANLLIRNLDILPVASIAKQLRVEKQLLHWYLQTLFTRIPEQYNTQEYADYHVMQVTLHAEFAPKFIKNDIKKKLDGNENSKKWINFPDLVIPIRPMNVDSDFLNFLKTSNFAPLDLALRECEKRKPPLYPEIIYLLARMGNKKEALSILLREIGDVYQAIEFVSIHDVQLWTDLVDYSLQHHDFLANLLDFIGICNINPINLIAQIPKKNTVEFLRQRIERIIRQFGFQVFLNEKCNGILEHDTLTLLRQLNQGQRRAIRIDPQLRCGVCSRPLYMMSGSSKGSNIDFQFGSNVQIWGSTNVTTNPAAAIIFSNKLACHRSCFLKLDKMVSI